jgi:hypothetical protein
VGTRRYEPPIEGLVGVLERVLPGFSVPGGFLLEKLGTHKRFYYMPGHLQRIAVNK